jgi:hypothetical protein
MARFSKLALALCLALSACGTLPALRSRGSTIWFRAATARQAQARPQSLRHQRRPDESMSRRWNAAIFVTLNDTASSILVLPNSGNGGGNNLCSRARLVNYLLRGRFEIICQANSSSGHHSFHQSERIRAAQVARRSPAHRGQHRQAAGLARQGLVRRCVLRPARWLGESSAGITHRRGHAAGKHCPPEYAGGRPRPVASLGIQEAKSKN